MKIKWGGLLKGGRCLYLAYDQGLEHGPIEFNEVNANPIEIIRIAQKGKFNGLIFQKGIAEHYNKEIKKSKVPLIIKLNGKTNLYDGEPISRQLCSVAEAVKIGASAVGYTIYAGSANESVMMQEFEKIEEEAHKKGIPVIAWVYPRGKGVKEKTDDDIMEYACRIGLELGADMVKVKYSGNKKALKFAVKSAGKCKVVIAGGIKTNEKDFLKQSRDVMDSGACGIAVGRNVWQAKKPMEIVKKLREIVF